MKEGGGRGEGRGRVGAGIGERVARREGINEGKVQNHESVKMTGPRRSYSVIIPVVVCRKVE